MPDPLTFLSVCSGIEAASVAFMPLGWRAVGFSEIEPFPCAVLKHHYPEVPNYGDLTQQESWKLPRFDVLCGGTPCQGFSVAGKRGGLADARSQLVWHFLEIARRERPRWVLWENVPGVLSSEGGADFGAVLGRLGECGYGFAYRVLDAQYFGVAQRRRRVFVVGYLGDWRPAAAVLFERESMSGNPAPRRETGKSSAHPVSPCIGGSGRGFGRTGETRGQDPVVAHPLKADGFDGSEDGSGRGVPMVSQPLRAGRQYSDMGDGTANIVPDVCGALNDGAHQGGVSTARTPTADESSLPCVSAKWAKGTGGPAGDEAQNLIAFVQNSRSEVRDLGGKVGALGADHGAQCQNYIAQPTIAFKGGQGAKARSVGAQEECSPTLGSAESGTQRAPTIAFSIQERAQCENLEAGPGGGGIQENVAYTLEARNKVQSVGAAMAVRRLTPRECERLQGFPDDYTLIPYRNKPAADGPRYKALGNSWAVPCARYIGERIQLVESLLKERHG